MKRLMIAVSLVLLALSVHTYGMGTDALNSGVYVDLTGPYCAGIEFRGNAGPFWYLPGMAGGGSEASCK